MAQFRIRIDGLTPPQPLPASGRGFLSPPSLAGKGAGGLGFLIPRRVAIAAERYKLIKINLELLGRGFQLRSHFPEYLLPLHCQRLS